MDNSKLPKETKYDVEIKTKNISINKKGISYERAIDLWNRTLAKYPNDTFLQENKESIERSFGFSGVGHMGNDITISAYIDRVKGTEKQTCRSRMEQFGPWEHEENLDTWDKIGNERVCSFCGSMHPMDFLELIKQRGLGVIGGTTKGYKWYVNRPEIPNAGFGAIKYYRWHDTQEFLDELNKIIEASKTSS